MRYFPAFLDLDGRRVLVVGHGEVAERKAEPLRRAGAAVTVAPHFAPDLLEGCVLAVGADAPEADLQALSAAAQARGVPVNVVDRPELCSFITPAVVDRDPLVVAISSGGTAPVLARRVRQQIEALLPPGIGRIAALADRLKAATRARLPAIAARRRFLDAVLAGPAAALAVAGHDEAADAAFRAALDGSEAAPPGLVHLVGAGPGAADLLTLRALRLLGEADVIVHDRLVPAEVLDMARRDAERIYVGKERARHCVPQDGINALLVAQARLGRRVVRLKGGDPFVFGRGGEEAEALAAAGIPFEVVPGISAALACGAGALIPLTHRETTRTLVLATGHTREGRIDLDFEALARPGQTLAIYMGVTTLGGLRDGLVAAGYDPATPAALVEHGGTARQRVLDGTLESVAARGRDWHRGGPALLLAGPAVGRAIRPAAAVVAAEPVA